MFLYDGKTGTKVDELSFAEGRHTGTVFSLSWNPDSKQLASASADMTTKIWDISTKQVIRFESN
jgi:WD repeat-containing protein 1 (actin-interacting protein 1)